MVTVMTASMSTATVRVSHLGHHAARRTNPGTTAV